MCGRFTLRTPAPKLVELFRTPEFPTLFPRYNIAPTQSVLIVRLNPETQTTAAQLNHEAVLARWGLIPFWAKDQSIGNRMINARSETAAEKPAFRQAFQKRRCLVPADGFFEWETIEPKKKQPWLIHMHDSEPFVMAGLWECWKVRSASAQDSLRSRSPEPNISNDTESEFLISCTILTTHANEDMRSIHDRMPVILQPDQYDAWLSNDSSPEQRKQLMQPLQNGLLQRYRVSTVVNKPGNDVPECVQSIDE